MSHESDPERCWLEVNLWEVKFIASPLVAQVQPSLGAAAADERYSQHNSNKAASILKLPSSQYARSFRIEL